MPAPASYARRQFPGAAVDTTITADINNSALAVTLAAVTGWPTGGYTGGVLCEFYSTTTGATAEKVWATDLTGSTLTIVRAADGTSATSHSAGTGIRPVAGAVDADEANRAVNETIGQVTTAGDLLVADGAASLARLAVGASARILQSNGTTATWVAVSGDVTIAAGGAVTIGNDKIDSQHYVDGSIDTAHLGDDQVTLDKLAAAAKPRWMVGPFVLVGISTAAMTYSGSTGTVAQIPMPEACAVTGIAVAVQATRTSGSGSFEVTIDGVGTGLIATIDDNPTQYATATQAETADAVAAGQRIGVTYTDSALALTGGANELVAYVLVQAV